MGGISESAVGSCVALRLRSCSCTWHLPSDSRSKLGTVGVETGFLPLGFWVSVGTE